MRPHDLQCTTTPSLECAPEPNIPVASANGLSTTELLTAHFRRALDRLGLRGWPIHCTNIELDADRIAADAARHGLPVHRYPLPLIGREQPHRFGQNRRADSPTLFSRPPGLLHLPQQHVAMARWFERDERGGAWDPIELWAARRLSDLEALHQRDRVLERQDDDGCWQVVGGQCTPSFPRTAITWDEVILPVDLKQRFERDALRFFDERVRKLHEQLGVPHQRGVLLHGPPGNGKTTLIRLLAAQRPDVAAILLRPDGSFDDNDLDAVFARCAEQAPAMLVIEDLDTLFTNSRVTVSGLLNKLDGAVTHGDGALLVVASTNHPDRLDPALNNRPGRFDVVLEVPQPDTEQRRAFFARRLPRDTANLAEALAGETAGLSFAHFEELLRTAGLLAIHDGREYRCDADVWEAVRLVRAAAQDAQTGFSGAGGGFGFRHGRE